jgi:uncharacterized caspase-like protein
MRRGVSIILAGSLAFGVCALICGICDSAQAQQSITPTFNETFQSAFTEARQECTALWSDHAFDFLRSKIPLGEDKPTFAMLTNSQKLSPKDKPVADSAIKTLEKCRAAYAPVYAMLPSQVNTLIQGVQRRQDDLIARLYNEEISYGDFNVGMNELNGKFAEAISGIPSQPKPASSTSQVAPKTVAQVKLQPSVAAPVVAFNGKRLALVIGNGNYANLPKLSNPTNDARSIADAFQKMGYKTQLILDATEDGIRSAVRKFASESESADVAIVYYAGHGAQLNGSNYILPTDIDIPRTAADIQFTGLKVDDLVNSIGSNTKIVFLDACRDNPVLYKNIVSGRGSGPIGLAPATASNFKQSKPGGGVFIAYATDADAVADDGKGQHSPFTQALLRYMQKPISIDDMFSLVTREVRLTTKDMQRPFKYASLENIVCLTPACSSVPSPVAGDIVQQAQQSEDDEYQIALQANNVDALETYLQKYPETTKRAEVISTIEGLRRSELTEWTLYEVTNPHIPNFMQLSSIQQFGDKAVAKVKFIFDPSAPKVFFGKPLPDADYEEDLNVYDCTKPVMATSEQWFFSKSGELLFHYKWADPQYLNLAIGATLPAGSVGSTAGNIACHEDISAPLVSKEQLAAMKFSSLSSTIAGDGEIFYGPVLDGKDVQNQKEILFILKNDVDHSIAEFLPENASIPDPPNFRTEVDRTLLSCDKNEFTTTKVEFWNASNQLVRLEGLDPTKSVKPSEYKELSPFATLQAIVCKKTYGGLGIRLDSDHGSIEVAEVFGGSPAEKAGVKANDIITQINHEPLSGLAIEQVIEKSRGPANTQVVLTISRKGRDNTIDLTVTRENIQMQATELGPSK